MGIYAALLESYGLLARLEEVVDPQWDRVGLAIEAALQPRRIRGEGQETADPLVPRGAPGARGPISPWAPGGSESGSPL